MIGPAGRQHHALLAADTAAGQDVVQLQQRPVGREAAARDQVGQARKAPGHEARLVQVAGDHGRHRVGPQPRPQPPQLQRAGRRAGQVRADQPQRAAARQREGQHLRDPRHVVAGPAAELKHLVTGGWQRRQHADADAARAAGRAPPEQGVGIPRAHLGPVDRQAESGRGGRDRVGVPPQRRDGGVAGRVRGRQPDLLQADDGGVECADGRCDVKRRAPQVCAAVQVQAGHEEVHQGSILDAAAPGGPQPGRARPGIRLRAGTPGVWTYLWKSWWISIGRGG